MRVQKRRFSSKGGVRAFWEPGFSKPVKKSIKDVKSVTLALSLLAALLVFLFDICAVLLTIASVILTVLGVALFFTPTPIGGIVFLFLAFLLSPYGLQAAAGSLLWALDGGKSALYRFLAS